MQFTYTGIRVRDIERSIEFYTKVMKMKLLFRAKMQATGGEFAHLKSLGSQQRLELNWYPRNSKYYCKYREGDELDHIAFWVKDVDKEFRELTKKGAKKAIEPFSEGSYRLAFVKEPEGIWIELLGREKKK